MAKKKLNTLGAESYDWETERDLQTLIDAEKIEKDPKRFKKAKELAKQKMLEAAAVATDEDAKG